MNTLLKVIRLAKIISITGKGGTGKSTISALLAITLSKKGRVLVVDADPNSNVNELLGLPVKATVGGVRESALKEQGITKQEYIRFHIEDAISEGDNIDLIVMGRPEGRGCYCFANSMIRDYTDTIMNDYDFVIIDNEAGLEHLSRRTTVRSDFVLIVSDSFRATECAARIIDLAKEVEIDVGKVFLILNKAAKQASEKTENLIKEKGIEVIARIPSDPRITEADENSVPLSKIGKESDMVRAVEGIVERMVG